MKTIACLGSGNGTLGDPCYNAMVEVGHLLAKRGFAVATGGFGGAGMEAPARGAKETGGVTIGYTMLGKKPNKWIMRIGDCAAQYHIGFFTPPIPEIQYGIRLGSLLSADGFIITAGGGPGSMVEFLAIVNLNCKLWGNPKRFTILNVLSDKGWDTDMCQKLNSWGVFPEAVEGLFITSLTPQQAVDWVCR
ncbi:MAG: hypothetical protein Q7R65_01905 [bacterium]|nr:hypothetical protein [bacterium]